ncbi:MAG: ABC transporter ATP-binding protein, partial [Verrucomicrobiota bacterium]
QLGFEPGVTDWEIARLSSGERQRLAFARLLVQEPNVLLLDEPTANLDTTSTQIVETMIADYSRRHQAPALWVIHHPDQLQRVATRSLVIEDGQWKEVPVE